MSDSSAAPARDPIDDCVHCGFCLPACPTYVSWSEEMDSPRGRIYLMKGLRDGALAWDERVAAHFDRCLGCMGCVTACPSGVRYDVLIESTRAARERAWPRRVSDRLFRSLLFALLPFAGRMRALGVVLWLYAKLGLRAWMQRSGLLARLSPRLAQLHAIAPAASLADLGRALPAFTPALGDVQARVGLLAGCVQGVFFPGVNEATVRVLQAEGCDVAVPAGQGCCGALSLHAGRDDEARGFARKLIVAFEDAAVDFVVVNAAGCGSALKEYGRLLADDRDFAERARRFAARVRDACELLAELPPRARRHPIAATVALHEACHVVHAQRVGRQTRAVLAAIPELIVRDIPDGDQCCGSAGIYNLVEPASANAIGERKVDQILRTSADVLVSGNPGCTLHLQRLLSARGAPLRALHPIEVLDRSLRRAPLG